MTRPISRMVTVADIEAALARDAHLSADLKKMVVGAGRIEVNLQSWGRSYSDDNTAAKTKVWATHARRIESCGGRWLPVRGITTRVVYLPLPFTYEARRTLMLLVDEYTHEYSTDKAIVTPAGSSDMCIVHVGRRRQTNVGMSDEERAQRQRDWSDVADLADGYVRGAWQARVEREYDAHQVEERERLRWLVQRQRDLLAQLADVDQKISAERDRISHLHPGIRRAIEAEAARASARTPLAQRWSP